MFRQEGLARSARDNRIVAGYLALAGGFVNSAGFVLLGTFTSHVTGNVGRLANELSTRDLAASLLPLALIAAFAGGAFVASMCVESRLFGSTPAAYCAALTCEVVLLAAFTVAACSRLGDAHAALLCAAMGMQNSLVTRLSGAVVRTTHLTGVVTDLGIEAARWFRWWRGQLSDVLGVRLVLAPVRSPRPSPEKVTLLLTIAASFTTGAVAGAFAGRAVGAAAMAFPTVAVGAAAVYAFRSRRQSAAPAADALESGPGRTGTRGASLLPPRGPGGH